MNRSSRRQVPARQVPPAGFASPRWVAEHLGATWLRILDVRSGDLRLAEGGRRAESGVRALETLAGRPAFVELAGRGWARTGPRPRGGTRPLSPAFLRGHIPGASSLDVARTLFDDGDPGIPVTAPELAMAMSELGVDDEHAVVVVDEGAGTTASVAAWVLRHYGHEETLVLAGGLSSWVAEDLPLTREVVKHPFASFTARTPR